MGRGRRALQAASLPRPHLGAVAAVVIGAIALIVTTAGSDISLIVIVTLSSVAMLWLHALLVDRLDIAGAVVPASSAAGEDGPGARVSGLRSDLHRAIARPNYERTIRPLLADLATSRLSRRGVDPTDPEHREQLIYLVGEDVAEYLFPLQPEAAPPLDHSRLEAVLTEIEDL